MRQLSPTSLHRTLDTPDGEEVFAARSMASPRPARGEPCPLGYYARFSLRRAKIFASTPEVIKEGSASLSVMRPGPVTKDQGQRGSGSATAWQQRTDAGFGRGGPAALGYFEGGSVGSWRAK